MIIDKRLSLAAEKVAKAEAERDEALGQVAVLVEKYIPPCTARDSIPGACYSPGRPDKSVMCHACRERSNLPAAAKEMLKKARKWDALPPVYTEAPGTGRCAWKDCDRETQPETTVGFHLSSFCTLHREDSKDLRRVKAAWKECKASKKELRECLESYQNLMMPILEKENARLREMLQEAMTGLEWWEKTYPESHSEADEEFKVRAQAALSPS